MLRIFLLVLTAAASTHLNAKGVTLAWDAAPRTIDPRFTLDAKSHYLADLQHCALVAFNDAGNLTGELATAWKWKNPKLLEMKIRTGIKFSDKTPVTVADIKATYDFFSRTDLKKPSPLAGAFKRIERVEVASKDKIRFYFKEPDSSFVQNFIVGILPKDIAKKEMLTNPTEARGCGPFMLEANNATEVVLKKNPNYNLGKPAKLDKITIKIVKDEFTRFAKLEKGELDLTVDNLNREKVAKIAKAHPNLSVLKRVGLNTTYLGFNFRDKVVGNPKIRRAIAHAINRKVIIDIILNGMATPATTLLTPSDPFLNKSIKQVTFDLTAAKKLVKESGLKTPIKLSYKTTTNVTRINIAKAIASQLKKVGFQVSVQPLEWGKFKTDVEAGRVQMWSLGWVGFKDPDIYRYAFASESFPPNGGNRGWYKNDALDKLLAEARVTVNSKTRKALYAKIQQVVADELPYVFLWHEQNFAVLKRSISGFKLYADGRLTSLEEVSVE